MHDNWKNEIEKVISIRIVESDQNEWAAPEELAPVEDSSL